MKPIVRYALLTSALFVAGAGIAATQFDRPPQPPKEYAGASFTGSARGAGKFFARYDLNHDGKVSRDEMNKTLAQEFAQAAGSAPAMTEAQFIAFRMKDLRAHTDQMFHRDDWNGDGKLSLDEYATPERVRFEYADRDGTGTLFCGRTAPSEASKSMRPRRGSGGGGGRNYLCKSADLNNDGHVTRAEFDRSVQQEFASFAKGPALIPETFYALIASHVRASSSKMFERLDRNHDGKIDRGEYAQSQTRYFAKLDSNNDGVVTRDEFYAARRYAGNGNRKPEKS